MEETLRILLIAPQPFFQVRGTPLAVKRLLQSLSALGHSVTVLTYPLGQDVELPHVQIRRAPRLPFLKSIQIGPSPVKLLLDPFLFWMAAWALMRRRYDLLHGIEEGAFIAAPLSRLFRVPMVYDMDSNIPEQLQNSGFMRNALAIRLVVAFERWVLRGSKAVVTVCQALTEHAQSLCPEATVFQIEDAPLMEDGDTGSIREELGLGHGLLAAYTGNFESYQGLDLLMDSLPTAFEQVKDLFVVLVGGEGARLEWAIRRSEDLGLGERLRILPQRPPAAMAPFLREADILLSPRKEGHNTPFKIFTYLASGKPLLATRLPTHTQLLTDELACMVDPIPEAFAMGLVRLARDPGLRERLGRAGQAFVEDRFGQKRYEEKVSRLMRHLALR